MQTFDSDRLAERIAKTKSKEVQMKHFWKAVSIITVGISLAPTGFAKARTDEPVNLNVQFQITKCEDGDARVRNLPRICVAAGTLGEDVSIFLTDCRQESKRSTECTGQWSQSSSQDGIEFVSSITATKRTYFLNGAEASSYELEARVSPLSSSAEPASSVHVYLAQNGTITDTIGLSGNAVTLPDSGNGQISYSPYLQISPFAGRK